MDPFPVEPMPVVVRARVVGPYSVELEFDDGLQKRVDLRPLLNGPVFQPLLDPAEFARLHVDPEAGTIVWPNQADIAPETLYDLPDERAA